MSGEEGELESRRCSFQNPSLKKRRRKYLEESVGGEKRTPLCSLEET